jgi:hypothetical protein
MINSIYYQEQHCKCPSLHIHSYFPILSFNLLSLYTLFYSLYASFLLTKHKKIIIIIIIIIICIYPMYSPLPSPSSITFCVVACFFSPYAFIFNLCLIGRFCFSSSLFSFSKTRDKKKQKNIFHPSSLSSAIYHTSKTKKMQNNIYNHFIP